MKISDIILPFFSVLILAAGCMEDENPEVSSCSELSISSVSTRRGWTKAVIEGSVFPDSDAETGIGLFLLNAQGGSSYDGKAGYGNIRYYESGKGWKSDTPMMLSGTKGVL